VTDYFQYARDQARLDFVIVTGPPRLTVAVRGTAKLAEVVVIRNGAICHSVSPEAKEAWLTTMCVSPRPTPTSTAILRAHGRAPSGSKKGPSIKGSSQFALSTQTFDGCQPSALSQILL